MPDYNYKLIVKSVFCFHRSPKFYYRPGQRSIFQGLQHMTYIRSNSWAMKIYWMILLSTCHFIYQPRILFSHRNYGNTFFQYLRKGKVPILKQKLTYRTKGDMKKLLPKKRGKLTKSISYSRPANKPFNDGDTLTNCRNIQIHQSQIQGKENKNKRLTSFESACIV